MTTSLARTTIRLAATAAGAALTFSPAGGATDVETVQRAAAEWAGLRAELARLHEDWDLQRRTLEASLEAMRARVAGLEREAARLEAEIRAEAAHSSESDPDDDNAHAREMLEIAGQRLDQLVERLATLRPRLPPRLSEGLELPFRSIQDAGLGTAARIQHVATILNRCTAFNRTFTLAEEELALDDSGQPRLLEVLHVGLSHAYAYDRAQRLAYLGRPGAERWTWESRPDAAEAAARMIAVFRQEADPAILFGPAQIADSTPPGTRP